MVTVKVLAYLSSASFNPILSFFLLNLSRSCLWLYFSIRSSTMNVLGVLPWSSSLPAIPRPAHFLPWLQLPLNTPMSLTRIVLGFSSKLSPKLKLLKALTSCSLPWGSTDSANSTCRKLVSRNSLTHVLLLLSTLLSTVCPSRKRARPSRSPPSFSGQTFLLSILLVLSSSPSSLTVLGNTSFSLA